jgi:hypothetical protein
MEITMDNCIRLTDVSRMTWLPAAACIAACALSACTGQTTGASQVTARAVAAPVAQVARAAQIDTPKISASSESGVLDVSTQIAARPQASAATAELRSTLERELGTASDGGYHAYPVY